jgi:hypothetical protein
MTFSNKIVLQHIDPEASTRMNDTEKRHGRPSTAGPTRRFNDKKGRQVTIQDEMETVSSLDTRRNTAIIQGQAKLMTNLALNKKSGHHRNLTTGS